MNPIISIIIPCYNSEATLDKTLRSVIEQEFQDWEVLIINDGSTDDTEKVALEWVNKDNRFKYFSKQNEGLGKTRNFGINKATGTYILPLDSDNLIERDFIQDAINVFENNPEIGIVHGHAEYFGEKTGIWIIEEFNLTNMLAHNYIDACAIYKKVLWQQVGGYDENMPHQGNEDWELWLAFGVANVKFYHLKKVTFQYFVSKNSMIRSFSEKMIKDNQDYILKKYSTEYHSQYCKLISSIKKKENYVREKLKSKKVVMNLFTHMFFRFKIFTKIDDKF